MKKYEKIMTLTTNKTRKFVLTLNTELIDLLKCASADNNVKLTHLIELWMIKFLDENGYLDD